LPATTGQVTQGTVTFDDVTEKKIWWKK